jgi:hypothetical protein
MLLMSPWITPARGQQHGPTVPPPGFYNGLTPTSTVPGDVMRLTAASNAMMVEATAFATRLGAIGQYQLNRAHADAIDSVTMMAWNEYYHAILNEQERRNRLHRAARRESLKQAYAERRERIENKPEILDLLNGDSLNAILVMLSDPRIPPSFLRGHGDIVPGVTIHKLTFHYAASRLTISVGRLMVRGGWPLIMCGADFDKLRADYLTTIEEVLERCRAGALTPEAFRAAQRAVAALDAKLKSVAAHFDNLDYARGYYLVRDLKEAVDSLSDQNTERVLGGLDRYAGTTVGDLATFMQRFNLRFGLALTPDERDTYHMLYIAMLRLRDQIAQDLGLDLDRPARARKPAPAGPPQPPADRPGAARPPAPDAPAKAGRGPFRDR